MAFPYTPAVLSSSFFPASGLFLSLVFLVFTLSLVPRNIQTHSLSQAECVGTHTVFMSTIAGQTASNYSTSRSQWVLDQTWSHMKYETSLRGIPREMDQQYQYSYISSNLSDFPLLLEILVLEQELGYPYVPYYPLLVLFNFQAITSKIGKTFPFCVAKMPLYHFLILSTQ